MSEQRKYDESIKAKGDVGGSRVKCSYTLRDVNEEAAFVLAKFMPENWTNKSRIIDYAMTELMKDPEMKRQLAEGYRRWKTSESQ